MPAGDNSSQTMDKQTKVLLGRVSDLPPLPRKCLKLYISANRSDFELEREMLWTETFPDLQQHCVRYGVDVVMIDANGDTSGDGSDHVYDRRTFDIHMKELTCCSRESCGPFVLCLLGNLHGPCPLPDYLDETEYEHIRNEAFEAGRDIKILDEWYKKDINIIPPAYVLLSSDEVSCDDRSGNNREQAEVHYDVLDLLQYGASEAYREGLIHQHESHKQDRFFSSGVEIELAKSLELSPKRCIAIMRTFKDLPLNKAKVPNYIDISESGKVNDVAQNRLRSMRENITFYLNNDNRYTFEIPWCTEELLTDNFNHQHKENLCTAVGAKIKKVFEEFLLDECDMQTPLEGVNKICWQALINLTYAKTLVQHCGTYIASPSLAALKDRFADGSHSDHRVVVIYGQPACGKTCLVSHLVLNASDFVNDAIVIVRYRNCGCTTMDYSDIFEEKLESISQQISYITNSKIDISTHDSEVLNTSLRKICYYLLQHNRQLLILLDGVLNYHELVTNMNKYVHLFSCSLPSKIHIVITVSVLEVDLNAFKTVLRELTLTQSSVKQSDLSEAAIIDTVEKVLEKHQRQITCEQQEFIVRSVSMSNSRYHMNLLIEEAAMWTSYQAPSPDYTPLCLAETIGQRFAYLEARYGDVIITHVTRYLLLAAAGLSEMEILDLLSCNNDVILACYPHSLPSVMRVPSSLWVNIKHDMGSFLMMQFADNKWLITMHSEVRIVARELYLQHNEDIRQGHIDIAQLFLESWLGSKPLVDKDRHISLLDQGNRLVCQQPLLYSETRYNLRRINHLWYHLLHAGEIESFKDYTYCNFEYMLATAHIGGVRTLLTNLQTTLQHLLDAQLYLILHCIKLSLTVLQKDPLQLASEFIGRLKQLRDYYPSYIEPLVTQCMQWCDAYQLPLVVPLTTWLPDIRKQTLVRIQMPVTITCILPTPNSQHVFCATNEYDICMYHVPLKKLIATMSGHCGVIRCLVLAYNSRRLASGADDGTVRLWDIVSSNCTHVFREQSGPVLCLAITHYNKLVCGSVDSTVVVLDPQLRMVTHVLRSHNKPVTCVLLCSNDTILASSSMDGCVIIWSMEDMSRLNSISVSNMAPITTMDLSADKTFLILGCNDCTGMSSVHVFSFTTGTEIHILSGHSSKVTCLRISGDCRHAVVACDDGSANVYNVLTTEMLQRYKPHTHPILSLHVSNCTDLFFTASQTEVCVSNVYKTAAGEVNYLTHESVITCIKVTSHGKYVLSGGKDSCAKLWNLDVSVLTEEFIGHRGAITCVDIATDEAYVVTGSEDTTVKVWSVTLANIVTNYECHKHAINSAIIFPDNRRILSSDIDDTMRVWIADSGQSLLCLTGSSRIVTVSPNGELAVTGGVDACVHIWNSTNGDVVMTINHSEAITCVVYSNDSQFIVTASEDMSLKVWQLATGKLTQVLVEHTDAVTCAAVTCDNKNVISGSRDNDLIIWSMEYGTMEHKLSGHTDAVTVVKLTDDGTVGLSGSFDGMIYVWRVKDGAKLTQFDTHLPVKDLAITFDAAHIAVLFVDSQHLPLLCLHNTPAVSSKAPPPSPSFSESEESPSLPMRPRPLVMRRPSSEFLMPHPIKDFHISLPSIPDITIMEHSQSSVELATQSRKASAIPLSRHESINSHDSITQRRRITKQMSLGNKPRNLASSGICSIV